jgi:hypothetical protein
LLDSDGNFTREPKVLFERDADADEMLREVEAQLRRAREAGFAIAYLDEHMGVGWLPGLSTRLRQLCRREGLRYAGVVPSLPRLACALPDLLDDLQARLEAAPPGAYVYVTHPTFDDEEVQQVTRPGTPRGQIARERDADRRLWCDERLDKLLRDAGVEAARYSDVLTL